MITKAHTVRGISESSKGNVLRVVILGGTVIASIAADEGTTTYTKADIIETPVDMFQLNDEGNVSDAEVKAVINDMVLEAELTADEVTAILSLYPAWEPGKQYTEIGELCVHAGVMYKVLQPHIGQADWAPDVAVSLFADVTPEGVIPEWAQPESTNPYMTGDLVTFNGRVYESTIDNNVWSPEAYEQGWADKGAI